MAAIGKREKWKSVDFLINCVIFISGGCWSDAVRWRGKEVVGGGAGVKRDNS
jgi:hypothetical protein